MADIMDMINNATGMDGPDVNFRGMKVKQGQRNAIGDGMADNEGRFTQGGIDSLSGSMLGSAADLQNDPTLAGGINYSEPAITDIGRNAAQPNYGMQLGTAGNPGSIDAAGDTMNYGIDLAGGIDNAEGPLAGQQVMPTSQQFMPIPGTKPTMNNDPSQEFGRAGMANFTPTSLDQDRRDNSVISRLSRMKMSNPFAGTTLDGLFNPMDQGRDVEVTGGTPDQIANRQAMDDATLRYEMQGGNEAPDNGFSITDLLSILNPKNTGAKANLEAPNSTAGANPEDAIEFPQLQNSLTRGEDKEGLLATILNMLRTKEGENMSQYK
tara:strand:+ start:673 stop:1641 length:969 start_codon:yes stop_codon:yes gene_type:complete